MDRYFSDNYVTLDFEVDTSFGDFGHPVHKENRLLLASWKQGRNGRVVSQWGDELHQEKLLKTIEAADFIIAHNAKYELGWLTRCGLDLHDVLVFDTKLAEYVLFGNLAAGCDVTGLPRRSTSLDACCRRRGWKPKDPVVDRMMKHGVNPVEIPKGWLQSRCEQDVRSTHDLFLAQREALHKTSRLGVLHTRCIFTPVLADMELQGMSLDAERVKAEYDAYYAKLQKLEREFNQTANGINFKSPLQVAEFLYSPEPEGLGFDERRQRDGSPIRTESGRKKADKATIAALTPRTKRQKDFLKLRAEIGKVQAALSKSLEFFQGVCLEKGGKFHAEFNQTVTKTHRLSSSGMRTQFDLYDDAKTVQFQNMARIFKRLFCSRRPGWLMMEVDGSQLEFRVAADLGHDEQAIKDITDPDFDAHVQSAAIMNGMDYMEFLTEYRNGSKKHKLMRTAAKVDTFKPLYGGESGSKKQKKWYQEFKKRYSGIALTQEGWVEDVLMNKRLITPWGLRYYWPRAKRMHDGYVNVKSNIYNYPVQAFATAEIIPIAVTSLWHRLRGNPNVRMVNTVHDSVILEVAPSAVDEVREHAIEAFGNDVFKYLREVYGYEFTVPLGCGITVGTHWSEGDEESYNIWPDGNMERVQ